MTARLLLVSSLNLDLLANCLAVCNSRLNKTDVDTKLRLHLGNDNVKMLFAKTADNLLFCLGVVRAIHSRIFFLESGERLRNLSFVALCLYDNCHRHTRFRELHRLYCQYSLGVTEGVARHSFAELRHSTDVTCIDKVRILLLLSANTEELSESLGISCTSVYGSHIGSELTGDNLEVGKLSYKRVGNGFENESEKRFVFSTLEVDNLALIVCSFLSCLFKCRRHKVGHTVKKHINSIEV